MVCLNFLPKVPSFSDNIVNYSEVFRGFEVFGKSYMSPKSRQLLSIL
jgi:hypothetical protein